MADDLLIETTADEAENQTDPTLYLSDVFKHISHYRRRGHQIGRKVGDMLEVLTLAAIYKNEELRKRLVIEPKLEGFSGARHKVEFAIYDLGKGGRPVETIPQLLSFIECKKVGVEQTVNSQFKKNYSRKGNLVPYGDSIAVNFNPRWGSGPTKFSVAFSKTTAGSRVVVTKDGKKIEEAKVADGQRLIFCLTREGKPFFVNNEGSLRDIPESIRMAKILEIGAVRDDGVVSLLNDCLTGPQTPEKAKQASFVALDIRKGRFGQFDKRPNERECVSILVLTEFSHWETKSLNMVKSSLDHNLVVDDSLIIAALEGYEKKYGLDFLDRMTKEFFLSSKEARVIANELCAKAGWKIFRDISDNTYKSIDFKDGAVCVG